MPGPRNPGGGPIKPPAPIYPPKQPKPKPTQANYESAVLAMVDDVNNPKVATVYINNTIPPDDGYAIPSSLGVTFMAAPAAWNSTTNYTPGQYASVNGTAYKCVTANTNSQPPNSNWVTPSGVAFWNDPTLMDGGSWVTIDTVNKVIVNVQQGESNAPPVNPSDLFQYIKHNGAYNTTGNFQNPGPIDITQLHVNPNPSSAPVITGTPPSFSYDNANAPAFDVKFDIQLTTTNPPWLYAIDFFAVNHNKPAPTPADNPAVWSSCYPNATGIYTNIYLLAMTAGIPGGWDIYVGFRDLTGGLSSLTFVGTTASNPFSVSPGQLPGVGGTTLSVASPAVSNYVVGASNFSADLTFTPTYTAAKANIAYFLVCIAFSGQSTNSVWFYGTQVNGGGKLDNSQLPNSGSICTLHLSGMPTGSDLTVYLYAVGYDGSYIYPSTNPIITIPTQTPNNSALPKMPSGATISVSAVSESVYDGGMHTL